MGCATWKRLRRTCPVTRENRLRPGCAAWPTLGQTSWRSLLRACTHSSRDRCRRVRTQLGRTRRRRAGSSRAAVCFGLQPDQGSTTPVGPPRGWHGQSRQLSGASEQRRGGGVQKPSAERHAARTLGSQWGHVRVARPAFAEIPRWQPHMVAMVWPRVCRIGRMRPIGRGTRCGSRLRTTAAGSGPTKCYASCSVPTAARGRRLRSNAGATFSHRAVGSRRGQEQTCLADCAVGSTPRQA